MAIGATNLRGNFLTVSDDVAEGAKLVVEHLVSQGHQKIALINTPADLFSSSDFLAGFRAALGQAGLTIEDEYLEYSPISQKDGYQTAQTLLSRPDTPTAIVTADDVVALGAMAAVQDQGFEVGNDVVITGYGDILLTEYSQPPLTTVHRPTHHLGQQACAMLSARLRGEPLTNQNVVQKPSLVIRQSSDLGLWL